MKFTTIAIWALGTSLVGLAIWTASSAYIVWGIEQAKYEVLESRGGYEIRRYAPMLVAETEIMQQGRRAEGAAFRVLAGYIFGGNTESRNINMTAPVAREFKSEGREIAMTAPVLIDDTATQARMTFVMPSKFTRATIPTPIDSRVKIREVPERRIAALSFGWQVTMSRRAEKVRELLLLLKRDGIEPVGAPLYAGFNPPFSIPFLKRHEIHVEIGS